MKTVAQLDRQQRLVGYRKVKKLSKTHIEVPDDCDLPTDGRYRWDGARFVPLGHGYGKPDNPPVATDFAVFLMMRALVNEQPIPDECRLYVEWYEKNLRKRNEELVR